MKYSDLCSQFIFPIHEKIKRHDTVHCLNFLEQSQWWTEKRLIEYALQKKEKLLKEVRQNVPYYQNRQYFEVITKSILRENFKYLSNLKAKNCHLQRTGGSTGEPLHFLISNERIAHDVAAKWRATRWFDVDIGDKEWVFWGSPIELKSHTLAKKFRDCLLRSRLVPAKNLDIDLVLYLLKQMRIAKPKMLFGYPSILAYIAKIADKNKVKMSDSGIKVIFVTSEVLDNYQRMLIESVFNCKVANGYGGRESGFIAHECPYGSMHITQEDIIVEIIKTDGTVCARGEMGEIVITHLHTSSFPFIRYRTGDFGALESSNCDCGRKLPILSQLEGRSSDLILTQNGSIVHRSQIVAIITQEKGIERFKVVQQTLRDILVIIKGDPLDAKAKQRIILRLKKLLGSEVQVNIEVTSEIKAETSGKFRFVTSKVSQSIF